MTRYWVGVIDPATNGGYGFTVEAESVDAARELAGSQLESPYVVNGVRLDEDGATWLWSRIDHLD